MHCGILINTPYRETCQTLAAAARVGHEVAGAGMSTKIEQRS